MSHVAAIWVLTGDKIGDNAQVLNAARATGLPHDVKHIAVKPEYETKKPPVGPSLQAIDIGRSDPLEAPWPDVVITIGRRLSSVALWIKQQSGGRTRIALFNAPKGRLQDFDLIVAPAFYRLPEDPRICRIGLPLVRVDETRLAAARTDFAAAFAAFPRPLHVLLLGGETGDRKLGPGFAVSTLRTLQQEYAKEGSVFVSTSRRTPPAAADAIQAALRPQDMLYRWSPGDKANPYYGLLAHGDGFTVTSDSLSMMTEIARLGRPLVIAELPEEATPIRSFARLLGFRGARELGEVSAYLRRHGSAVRLGEPFPAAATPPPDDTALVARRLRELVG